MREEPPSGGYRNTQYVQKQFMSTEGPYLRASPWLHFRFEKHLCICMACNITVWYRERGFVATSSTQGRYTPSAVDGRIPHVS
jgi:hypothetical protein